MDKKEKISMILKILLVLVLVPMGVSFGWSNEKVCQQFTSTTQPNLDSYIKNNTTGESYNYNYATAASAITGQWNQWRQLNYSSRIFCLRAGLAPGTGNYMKNTTDPNSPIDILSVPYPVLEDSPQTIVHHHQNNTLLNYISLTSIPKFDGNGYVQTDTNNMAYALSFFEIPTNENVNVNDDEKAQRTIWAYNGYNEGAYQEDDLYKANQAYNEMLNLKKTKSITDINLTEVDTPDFGSHLLKENDKEFILVGPFHINDHPYIAAHEIDLFSGCGTEKGETLVGLINCQITIKRGNLSLTKEISGHTYTDDMKESDSWINATICYDKNGSTSAKNMDYSSKGNLKTPVQYSDYMVPYPDNDFYIKIDSSEIEVGDELTNVTLTARDTTADGNGCYITSTLDTDTYTKQSIEVCGGVYCNNPDCDFYSAECIDDEDYADGSEHVCDVSTDKYPKCEKDGKVNKPSDFIWKTVAISSDGSSFYSKSYPGKTVDNNNPETLQWAMAVTVGSDIFNEMYKHIRNSLSDEDKSKLPETISKSKGNYTLSNNISIDGLKEALKEPIKCKKSRL